MTLCSDRACFVACVFDMVIVRCVVLDMIEDWFAFCYAFTLMLYTGLHICRRTSTSSVFTHHPYML
jgi:hypothetical protein